MSLKSIHIIFVTASLLLTAFFGIWAWREYSQPTGSSVHLTYGLLSIVTFVALIAYGRYFLRKLKHISYL